MAIQRIQTKYGPIFKAEQCKDDYENLVSYDQGGGKSIITLQGPAIKSLKDAELALYRRLHPVKARWRKRRGKEPGREFILVLPGSKRSCSLQASLHARDPNRFAAPNVGLHTHGLAIDVSQAQKRRKLTLTYRVLAARGWNKSRPIDEPWHMSFHLTA
jgi:hypothetical protein